MLLLAIDTSGRQGGITLARGDLESFEIVESAAIQGGTFSAELIPQISELLSRNRLKASNLEALVAVTGPGSFTGLRVGLTAVKGLAEVLKLPIAGVSALEVLLAASGIEESAMAVLDAGRGEVYAAIRTNETRQEFLLSIGEAANIADAQNLQVIAPDRGLAERFRSSHVVTYCSSEAAARLGLKKLLVGDTIDVLTLDANYIRKSEAEYMQKLKK